MENTRPIIYDMGRKQLTTMLIFAIVMIVLGLWLTFLLRPHNYMAHYFFIGLGIVCLALGIFGLSSFIKRTNGPKEGLIINDEGIVDNTTGHGVPLIKWDDVKGIREEFVAMNKFVRVDVANAESYIKQGKTAAKRQSMKNYNRSAGSPFLITARALGLKHDELFQILRSEFLKEKEKRDANKPTEENTTSSTYSTPDELD